MEITSLESNASMTGKKRIEFIDAMRGFTMILVVVCHVSGFCLGIESDIPSIHPYLYEFRMPTFFFISGFVLYKANQIWDTKYVVKFLTKKFPVQIITTVIFFLFFLKINQTTIIDGLYSESKQGYWFTYCLFVYFIAYSICRWILNLFKARGWLVDFCIISIGFLFYILFSVRSVYYSLPINSDIGSLLSLQHWGYYLFFTIGTLFKKHYQTILEHLHRNHIILICLAIFFTSNLYYDELVASHINAFNLITAITGIVLVFSFFEKHKDAFLKEKPIGKALQYIGRRTLDIYLLHYLILPVNLLSLTSFLRDHPVPLIEFTISLVISLLVIGTCLILSAILRLSPKSAYFLFGVKKK